MRCFLVVMGWEDIGGLEDAKQAILDTVRSTPCGEYRNTLIVNYES